MLDRALLEHIILIPMWMLLKQVPSMANNTTADGPERRGLRVDDLLDQVEKQTVPPGAPLVLD
jgi:hypothetical protein